jgi:hypothetical protein
MTQAFNLSQLANNLNTSGQLDATDGLTGATPVANGGTGQSSLTANAVLVGNGTSGVTTVAPSTTGNVLTSNGTSWISQAISSGAVTVQTYDTGTSVTWTKPTTANWVLIEIWGGGASGGCGNAGTRAGGGGGGGAYNFAMVRFADLVGTVVYTVGAGGASTSLAQNSGNDGGVSTVILNSFAGGGNKTLQAFGGGYGSETSSGNFTTGAGGGGIYAKGKPGIAIAGTIPSVVSSQAFNDSPSYSQYGKGGLPSQYWGQLICGQSQNGYFIVNPFGGGFGSGLYTVAGAVSVRVNAKDVPAYYGGGGSGGGSVDFGDADFRAGGISVYGGGGGGAGSTSGNTTAGVAGTSTFGGNGGAGGNIGATSGATPAGGGGGSRSGASGAGGSGRVRFTYW